MKTTKVHLKDSGTEFTITDGGDAGAAITSTFGIADDDSQYSAALNSVESFILSMHCAGVDVTTPAFREALETTLDAIDNNYG